MILSGQKYTTWRVDDEKGISPGDEISFFRKDGSEFAKAVVISVKETSFEKLDEEDRKGHEKFASDEEMYATFSEYYKKKIAPQTKLKVIRFKLAGR